MLRRFRRRGRPQGWRGADGGQDRDAARAAFWTSSNEALPETCRTVPRNGSPSRSAQPTTLSTALCGPSSRRHSSSGSARPAEQATACTPPVLSNTAWAPQPLRESAVHRNLDIVLGWSRSAAFSGPSVDSSVPQIPRELRVYTFQRCPGGHVRTGWGVDDVNVCSPAGCGAEAQEDHHRPRSGYALGHRNRRPGQVLSRRPHRHGEGVAVVRISRGFFRSDTSSLNRTGYFQCGAIEEEAVDLPALGHACHSVFRPWGHGYGVSACAVRKREHGNGFARSTPCGYSRGAVRPSRSPASCGAGVLDWERKAGQEPAREQACPSFVPLRCRSRTSQRCIRQLGAPSVPAECEGETVPSWLRSCPADR